MRTAMRPDEAFGMIFSWDGVIADMQEVGACKAHVIHSALTLQLVFQGSVNFAPSPTQCWHTCVNLMYRQIGISYWPGANVLRVQGKTHTEH